MNRSTIPHRLPRRSIAVSAIETLTTGIPTAATLYAAQSRWPDANTWMWRGLWIYLIYTRIWATFIPYVGVRYSWDENHLAMTEGLLAKHEKRVAWDDVAALQTTQPWSHRLLRCVRICATSTGTHSAQLVLHTVTPQEAHAIEAAFHAHRRDQPHATSASLEAESPSVHERTIFTMPPKGILLTGLVYGQFFLAVPLVLELAGHAQDAHLISHTPWTWQSFASGRPEVWVAMIICATTIGVCISYVRYGHFRVKSGEGMVMVTRGLVERRRNVYRPDDVDGFLVRQNLAMQAAGYYRLDACSRAASRSEMSTTLLPCARWGTVVALSAELGAPVPPEPPSGSPLTPLVRAGLWGTTLSVGVGVALCWTGPLPSRWGAIAGALGVAVGINTWLGSATPPTDTHTDRAILRHRRLAPRWVITSASQVHGVEAVADPVLRRGRHRLLTCQLHIGRPLTFRAITSARIAEDMLQQAGRAS